MDDWVDGSMDLDGWIDQWINGSMDRCVEGRSLIDLSADPSQQVQKAPYGVVAWQNMKICAIDAVSGKLLQTYDDFDGRG